jgi:dTDP-glucose 4,6-dehydratase
MILVTGGAGFIGSNFVLDWIAATGEPLVNLDALTYAGNLRNLESLRGDARHRFVRGEIGDRALHGPGAFVRTNVLGTFELLEAVRAHWSALPEAERAAFRFLHVSTDEVYGSLGPGEPAFGETTPYAPNSPYSASKAGSDHLVRAYHHTYGLPTVTTNCSNNYGPFQFPEKLVPLVISNALEGKPLPVYGDGRQVRDWLYVTDHCEAIRVALERGRPGETYNIGGNSERANIEVVHALCDALQRLRPREGGYRGLVAHVADRPGHDRRYAIDARKIERELGWRPRETFATGLERTVRWYLEHADWVAHVKSGAYREWIDANYGARSAA